jgi:hypothetical protein
LNRGKSSAVIRIAQHTFRTKVRVSNDQPRIVYSSRHGRVSSRVTEESKITTIDFETYGDESSIIVVVPDHLAQIVNALYDSIQRARSVYRGECQVQSLRIRLRVNQR